MKRDLVLRVIAKLLIPFMLLFALYVQFHGELGPGGGFQAGVIIAAAIVFYAIIFGLPAAQRLLPDTIVETLVAAGVLIYAGVGVALATLCAVLWATGTYRSFLLAETAVVFVALAVVEAVKWLRRRRTERAAPTPTLH